MEPVFRVLEDTITEWTHRKQSGLSQIEEQLLNTLAQAINYYVKPYVPRDTGALENSPSTHWEITTPAEGKGMIMTWTGEDNPSRWSMFVGKNGEQLDYALFKHEIPMYHKKIGASDHYVEKGLNKLNEGGAKGSRMEYVLGQAFIRWLEQ